ncbi:MAG: hypothetical protein IJA71_10010, partial [Clostridia bacterium]|nr:hypothetical protein [Clostridia bacterium]
HIRHIRYDTLIYILPQGHLLSIQTAKENIFSFPPFPPIFAKPAPPKEDRVKSLSQATRYDILYN